MTSVDVERIGQLYAAPGTSYARAEDALCWEVAWAQEASFEVECGGRRYEVMRNGVVVTPPGLAAVYDWHPTNVTKVGYILFNCSDLAAQSVPLTKNLASDDVVPALLNHALWLHTNRPSDWHRQSEQALALGLHAYVSGASGTSARHARQFSDPIIRSMEFVHDRWSDDGIYGTPNLDELAQAASVSREHLCRLFAKEVGCGPAEALRLLRLEHSASLLSRTNLTVNQVSARAGFKSQFHFSRAFKAQYGVAPTDFRAGRATAAGLPDAVRRLGMHL